MTPYVNDPELTAWEEEQRRLREAQTHQPPVIVPPPPPPVVAPAPAVFDESFKRPPPKPVAPEPPPVDTSMPAPVIADPISRMSKSVTSSSNGGSIDAKTAKTEADRLKGAEATNRTAQEENILAVGQANKSFAEQQIALAKEREAVNAKAAEDRAKVEREMDGQIKAAWADHAARVDAHRKAAPKDFWADKSTGDKVLGILAVVLGGLGAALKGSDRNVGLDALNQVIERDYRRQIDGINKMRDEVEFSRGKAIDMTGRKEAALRNADAWRTAAYQTLADKGLTLLAQMGVPKAEREAHAAILGLREKAIEADREYLNKERQRVTTQVTRNVVEQDPGFGQAAVGKMTDAQGQAEATVRTMAEAYKTIVTSKPLSDEALKSIGEKGIIEKAVEGRPILNAIGRRTGLITQPLADLKPEQQRTALAWQSAHESILRSLTGAGATESEANRTAARIVPQPGDSAETVKFKTEQYRKFIEAQAVRMHPSRVEGAVGGMRASAQTQPSSRDAEAIQWARAHPNDPRSKKILQRNGL